ncbi:RagB/SusD family nutrient uptake outer membrane protein [Mucilaginibacter paludis]|uniref:RagB/SusD domain-containing protein n=1 Tax=Mucilaginibacter paludis DSM 18603 TaxID=714943 RepID=H1YA50_9SPHI|nr:RagB/SusD family nutrient uptake outer membrane protein [Mucilaginibacter paludis]EHQ25931.1 RagB/SusD domain-containing protein [Mucilaginibacter paludis DSM 18603]
MKLLITKPISIVLVLVVSIFCLSSCKKYLTVDAPNNKLSTASVFGDSTSASSAIVGIYSTVAASNTSYLAYLPRTASLCSDELSNNATRTGDMVDFGNNTISSTNATLNSMWVGLYSSIYQANAVIDGVTNSSGITPSAKNTLIAESKFIRAFCLFYLTNLWGDVPLTVSTDYTVTGSLGRAPSAGVYAQIISDLTAAQTYLPVTYLTATRVRPNKWTAAALLARVYLYQQNWQMAEATSNNIINSGLYPLSALNATFLATSQETVWQIYPAFNVFYNSFDGNSYVTSSASVIPNYLLSPNFLSSIETGDQRNINWIGTQVVAGVTYKYPYKYKVRRGSTPPTEYNVIFRSAEQYLIRAEARAQQGTNLAGAASDINVVRTRAGLPNTTASTQLTLLNAVYQERRVELFAEWGTRWFDLKRTGQADAVLKIVKNSTWKSTSVLWPIPSPQLLNNPYLVQNPGY